MTKFGHLVGQDGFAWAVRLTVSNRIEISSFRGFGSNLSIRKEKKKTSRHLIYYVSQVIATNIYE